MKRNFNIFFFFISFFLIFNNIPKVIEMNFLGGSVGNKLVFYPLFIGFIYTIYCQYKYKNVLLNLDKFIKFIAVYLVITFISLTIGLYKYPYYDLVINGPVIQIEKLPKVIAILDTFDINIDQKVLIAFWMIARVVKGLLFEIIYTLGGAYMIYCWYYDNWKTAFNIMLKAVLATFIFIFGYSVIEIFYLAGNQNAKEILEIITPYIHIVKSDGTWWPPLLWKSQLRSLFAEPSYYGIYCAFAMPILWHVTFNCEKIINKVTISFCLVFFTFCLFLTQARTAVALFAGEFVIFSVIMFYLHQKNLLRKFVNIVICIILAFISSNYFITNLLVDNRYKIQSAGEYIESNLTSLTSTKQRSNNSRYSIMLTDLKIGLDNPLLGVGTGLRNGYVQDYLPEMAKNNGEVKIWIKNQQEKGIMRSGFPKLGEYTSRFAETGVLGLAIFLMPSLVLLRQLYFKMSDKTMSIESKLTYVFFTISLIGIMTSGIGDTINITYCYWVLLGLGYAMCFGKENNDNNLIDNKNNE